jgi:TonB family protein
MKIVILCVCIACLVGCISFQQTDELTAPKLLFQTPLPAPPESVQDPPTTINLVVYILENGTVEQVRLLKSGGSSKWDSLISETIKQWKFTPARSNNAPISTWYYLRARLHYASPIIVSLSEILCTTKEVADSIYMALERGQEFNKLAREYSIDPSHENDGIIGEVNIYCYPENIQRILTHLDLEEYTQPIPYGDHYIVFKRTRK